MRNLYLTELVQGEDGTVAQALLDVIPDVDSAEMKGMHTQMR
ncbi:MAG: hypothetical protein R3C14_37000 [Caldilineaceae bacterium]